ncbi:condensation domain-containing protein [Amycolatopsis acidicola]|nr:condensation domain-containing protein [Amycolatopsis acidicola]
MRITAADRWQLAPGQVLSWRVLLDRSVRPEPVPLSVNQRNHLRAAVAGERTVWLAATFEVPGPISATELTAAYHALISRHSTLQCEVTNEDGEPRADRYDPAQVVCLPRWPRETSSPTETTELVRALLDTECAPFGYPAFALAAVSRPDVSTIVLGFDHLHVDAHSIALAVRDMSRLYRGQELPPAGCFVSRVAEWCEPPPAGDPHPALWRAHFESVGYRLPQFPLPLGLAPGATAEPGTELGRLADAGTTLRLAEAARLSGSTTNGALLTTLARALQAIGGPAATSALMPVQTRRPGDEHALGWFTTTAPVTADTSLAETAASLRRARQLAALPLDQALSSLSRPLRWDRRDVFMVSYVDYRRLPGAAGIDGLRPQHVSAAAEADGVQIWVARTFSGLSVRVRYPDTGQARTVVRAMVGNWREAVAAVADEHLAGALI